MKKYFGIFLLFFCIGHSFSQSSTCNNALPFCTGSTYTFPASTNTPAPSGAYFDCLWTQPNPAFYYCEIDQPGNMTISISSTPYSDIDFICFDVVLNQDGWTPLYLACNKGHSDVAVKLIEYGAAISTKTAVGIE